SSDLRCTAYECNSMCPSRSDMYDRAIGTTISSPRLARIPVLALIFLDPLSPACFVSTGAPKRLPALIKNWMLRMERHIRSVPSAPRRTAPARGQRLGRHLLCHLG